MKKPKIVVDAEAVAATKLAALVAARATVDALKMEHREALSAVRKAQELADAALPQCRLRRVGREGEEIEKCARHVILRKTPTGVLVTCLVGDPGRDESRFRWNGRAFVETNQQNLGYGLLELRDVPQEFMPQGAKP